MAIARALFLFVFATCVACFLVYAVTGQVRFRHWGLRLLVASVGLGLAFFLVLAALRLADMA